MHGMLPHIAQLVAGHRDINTTMGYKAVYPKEVINGQRAFIARRRALRPSQEYRTPTDAEWDEFLGHFERRGATPAAAAAPTGPVASTSKSCIRCSLLRPDPASAPASPASATTCKTASPKPTHRWAGEAEGL
jgi:hypothetical protein